jgi:hypothetical protein
MSQLAASDGQPGNWQEPGFFLRRLETVRFQENGWQEPCESRGSCTVVRGTGGEISPVYPTQSPDIKLYCMVTPPTETFDANEADRHKQS